jgi:hypothetical protein
MSVLGIHTWPLSSIAHPAAAQQASGLSAYLAPPGARDCPPGHREFAPAGAPPLAGGFPPPSSVGPHGRQAHSPIAPGGSAPELTGPAGPLQAHGNRGRRDTPAVAFGEARRSGKSDPVLDRERERQGPEREQKPRDRERKRRDRERKRRDRTAKMELTPIAAVCNRGNLVPIWPTTALRQRGNTPMGEQ